MTVAGTHWHWHQGLYRRIALGFLAAVGLLLMAQAAGFLWLFQLGNSSSDEMHQRGITWTRAISTDLGQYLETSPADGDIAARLAQTDATRRVFIIMRDGHVFGPAPKGVVDSVSADFAMVPAEGPLPGSWERSMYAGSALPVSGKVAGVVGITPPSIFERFGALIGAVGIILLIATIVVFSVAIVRPVRARLLELQTAAKKLGGGELDTRLDIEGSDEVADVARAFNAMADELERRTRAHETSDRLRRQLVADVSHELMTPLTAVLGHLETLDMDEVALDPAERRTQLAVAIREARRLRRLIRELLETAKLEAGGVELNCEEIVTAELFHEIQRRHAHECRAKAIAFDASIAPEAESFEADPFRIEQAIENVVANAFRHTPGGGRISLTAQRRGENIVIEVCDSGEGISPEHLPHIFDRFYKSSSAKGIASPGSGLGLSIVKAILNRHGGHVSASSAAGTGTIIAMELPVTAHLPEPEVVV